KDKKDKKDKKSSFKHLGVLRKALSKAHTGEIVYQTTGDEEGQINVTIGDLINDEATTHALEKLLTESIADCELITERIDEELERFAPPVVLTRVMNDIHWNAETLEELKKTFAKLPPIDVKMVPLHRYGYSDGLTYLMLYQESLKDEHFTTVKFFNERPAYTTLEQQIKVLVLGYCLGLINPQVSEQVKKKSKKAATNRRMSMASRILDKIRGM
ncbi:MAG: hypothetical protein Q9M10_00850, partial [Mariprofundaceae bacterium]|nr:hypothetical protein [Mariprofundaceae bacterium]